MRVVGVLLFAIFLATSASANDIKVLADSYWICHEQHPRCGMKPGQRYKYHQFGFRDGIGDYAGVSDVLVPGSPLEHYQTFISELISHRPKTNAVALWADSSSHTNEGRVWGGFLSARSELKENEDSQLIGLEIDVLNDGLPGKYPNASKVGLQIVGFGNLNTNAIEILTQSETSGQYMNAINVAEHTLSSDGTLFGVGSQVAALGINLQNSIFKDAAVLLSPENRIVFRQDGTSDAAVYRDNIRTYLKIKIGALNMTSDRRGRQYFSGNTHVPASHVFLKQVSIQF